MIPASLARELPLSTPPPLHQGLDRAAHALAGRWQRLTAARTNTLRRQAETIIAGAAKRQALSNRELGRRIQELAEIHQRRRNKTPARSLEAMGLVYLAVERTLGITPYPEQVMGALALQQGALVEMATGEGKTIAAAMAIVPLAWRRRPCHIVTANDYLAERDAVALRPFYRFCALRVGRVVGAMDNTARQRQYAADVVYTTGKELLADFLRDRLQRRAGASRAWTAAMSPATGQSSLVLRGLDTVIVDEADNVLIDEAVTPLIISHHQPNPELLAACRTAHHISTALIAGRHYTVDHRFREVRLTPAGRLQLATLAADLPGIWSGSHRREELILQALKARELFHRDQHYVVDQGKIVIVDEFTGRLMPDRTWKHGLHQAVEAKEGVELTEPSDTQASLSFQRFFRLFRHLCGMSGTVQEAAAEFWQVYHLPLIVIPTHRPCRRRMLPDRVFAVRDAKLAALVTEIQRLHRLGRPVLVGTRSVAASEALALRLAEAAIPHRLLNAVQNAEEAAIIAAAGDRGAVTIATNMAGRGTDIRLQAGVAALGGLHVIASERHESRRIDRQLFGRAGRQGDPGSGQAFVSLDDELCRRFLPAAVRAALQRLVRQYPSGAALARPFLDLAQQRAQRLALQQRQAVLAADTWLNDALSFATGTAEP